VPSALRRAARESLADRIAVLGEIANGVSEIALREKCPDCGYTPTHNARGGALRNRVHPRDQVRAIAELGTIGMSANVSIDDVKARMIEQVKRMREFAAERGPDYVAFTEELLDRVHLAWKSI
jgi:hypothetical protein